ncbi:MAG TPA: phospholipase D-like domain-containing protein [Terriglobia bacterium]|jgi:phosphatidylserine/phosphatidylglycerophosphate/cardiolipin synthase-like enzyme
MSDNVIFSRTASVAEFIAQAIRESAESLDAAVYRMNNLTLAGLLAERANQGVRIRLILDRGRYENDTATRAGLARYRLPFRVLHGRAGPGSKMHHKFAILDNRIVLTGSYNWTLESEEKNYEGLLVLREPLQVEKYREEFEALWRDAQEHA